MCDPIETMVEETRFELASIPCEGTILPIEIHPRNDDWISVFYRENRSFDYVPFARRRWRMLLRREARVARVLMVGAAGIEPANLSVISQVLYQLSYAPSNNPGCSEHV